ncbi:MAG: 1-(5-phosphoribosyl)-5-[(5-phosphoribosylamino)methylideneamino]imidazole-4-carboxamide isomerase [Bacteroidota bacterium]
MEIIPAIDLRHGKCVRLRRGREDAVTEYGSDPLAVAREWANEGARLLHVVNLDGAFGRESTTLDILRNITTEVQVRTQFGGGLRTLDAVEAALAAGAAKVIIGTAAMTVPGFLADVLRIVGPERVIVALDAVEGRIAVKGWTEVTASNVHSAALELRDAGVKEILYTDIHRDGMMSGPDLRTIADLADSGLNILASGGIASEADVRALLELKRPSISGAVVGRALYEREVSLRALIGIVKSHPRVNPV